MKKYCYLLLFVFVASDAYQFCQFYLLKFCTTHKLFILVLSILGKHVRNYVKEIEFASKKLRIGGFEEELLARKVRKTKMRLKYCYGS